MAKVKRTTAGVGDKKFKLKSGKIPLSVPFSPEELSRGEPLRRKKGLNSIQALIRIGYAELLEKNGL